jgi:hypothetical protein
MGGSMIREATMKRWTAPMAIVFVGIAALSWAAGQSEPAEITDATQFWTGERIEFVKPDGGDPTLAENQDRITESVWLTRANDGGQIFNIRARTSPSKGASPIGTLWALGTVDEARSLEFGPFRATVGSPKDVVGRDLVLYVIPEDIYIDIRFTSWSTEQRGGFAYRRSTPDGGE